MLDFNVRGENIEVTDALREYVEKRLTKLNRYIGEKATANVNLRTYHSDKSDKAEVTIVLPYVVLRAEAIDPDMYAAIDAVSIRRRLIVSHVQLASRALMQKVKFLKQKWTTMPSKSYEQSMWI